MIYLEPRNILDTAIIGEEDNRIIYSYSRLVDIYMDGGMDYFQAIEHIEWNIIGTYMEYWPIIIDDLHEDI